MTEQQIDAQINEEFNKFNQEAYSGDHALPKDLIDTYRKAIFKLPPSSHRTSSDAIKKIIGKKVKDLTNLDVPMVLNTITLCPFSDLYKDLDEALLKTKQIEELKISFNILVKGINEAMEIKRNTLIALATGKPKMQLIQ